MNEQPTIEQVFMREAMKHLTPKQLKVWEYHIFEQLTQDEIAAKLGKARTTIQTQIKQCEKSITKWCKNNMFAYEVLKLQVKPQEDTIGRPNGIREANDASHKTPQRNTKWEND